MKLRRTRHRGLRTVLIACTAIGICGATVVATAGAKASSKPLIVWIDTARVPYEKAYMKAHPGAIKWVLYNGNENGTGVLQSKFALWNRTGWPSNAPDVIFDSQNYDAVQLGSAPYNDLLNLKSYVPAKVLKNFAGTSMKAGCTTPSGQVVCLRNDSAAEVLWVDQPLWNSTLGASTPIPTTWSQYLADGATLTKDFPNKGYLIGSVGDGFSLDDYFLWANECPLDQVTGKGTIEINPSSSNCTTIMNDIDQSGDVGKSLSDESIFSVTPDDVVMAPGALWEGLDAFATGAKDAPPSTDMVAYPPLQATNGAKVTGDLGGGLWLVSKHSPDPKAAAALAQYMATSPKIQTPAVDAGLPQYVPDEASYLSSLNNVFGDASETEATWKAAAAEVWDGWSPVPWSTDNVWASTNLAAVTASPPASLAAQLVPYAEALANQARLAGYTVKSPNSTVATGS
jgi:ABC-type glycerol-3-phosphate transport system substrate-binding protein